MSIDVLTRLRAGSDAIEEHAYDAHEVLVSSRRALRRRRSWQALGTCTTAVAVAFSLALAGPVPVPGLGEVALPGSEQLRDLFGLADGAGCAAPEPAVRRTRDDRAASDITFHLTDARPMSGCYDVRVDGVLTNAPPMPGTLTDDGALWKVSEDGHTVSRSIGVDPGLLVPSVDENTMIVGVVANGEHAAWYEIDEDDVENLDGVSYALRAYTGGPAGARTVAEVPRWDTSNPVLTDRRVAWRHEDAVSVAPLDGSAPPELLTDRATAVGSDEDEIVVATATESEPGFWTTTFTSYGDDGSTTTVLRADLPGMVTDVDISDQALTYVLDQGDLSALPRMDGLAEPTASGSVEVNLNLGSVNDLTVSGGSVAWVTGPVAYLLQGIGTRAPEGVDLVRVAQSGTQERMAIGLAGVRIAWATWETTDANRPVVTVGTLVEQDAADLSDPGPSGLAVPAAPTVTVPENAIFRTYD